MQHAWQRSSANTWSGEMKFQPGLRLKKPRKLKLKLKEAPAAEEAEAEVTE